MPQTEQTSEKTLVVVAPPGAERSIWEAALAAGGWAVVCFDAAGPAIRRLNHGQPDVLVAEIGLRPAGGLELLRLVKAKWPGVHVICTAGQHRIADVLECLRGGAADYLCQPVEADQLVAAVEETCRAKPDEERIQIEMGEKGWIQLRMPSSEHSMQRLDKFFRTLYLTEVAPDTLEEISLCFTEIVRNAIEWGHRFDISKRILISHMLFQDEIVFKVEDTGQGFEMDRVFAPADDLMAMESEREIAGKRPGGLGLTMVAGLMDSVIYNRAGNMLVMSKKLYDVVD
ncbi:MAG: ATP-binding protein [Verrucomicrobia bacterium]|nr:ATP-binding protein [Verrucomicrobiota bacterium]